MPFSFFSSRHPLLLLQSPYIFTTTIIIVLVSNNHHRPHCTLYLDHHRPRQSHPLSSVRPCHCALRPRHYHHPRHHTITSSSPPTPSDPNTPFSPPSLSSIITTILPDLISIYHDLLLQRNRSEKMTVIDKCHRWAMAGDLRGQRECNSGGGDERKKQGMDRD